MNNIIKMFATCLGLGYMPAAPGTFGTLAGGVLFWSLSGMPLHHYIIFLVVFIMFSSWISDRARAVFKADDPKQVVIDEVAGYLVTMAGHTFSLQEAAAGFILFRIFDILKPFPVRRIDDGLHNGFGIVMDDVMAGIYANIALFIIMRLL